MSESSNAKPPRITKSVFNSILKQQQEAEANPKAKKEKKEGEEGATKKKEKKRKANRNFQVLVTDEEEYKSLIDRMEHSIKRTTDCPVGLVGNRYASFDPITGQPCLYFMLGIPHQRVGEKRNKGIAPNSDDCYGSFASEMTAFVYLFKVLSLPRDHPMVQQTREYFRVSPKTFANKFSDEAINTFCAGVAKSKLVPPGTGNPPHLPQLGKNQKYYKSVWFYNRPGIEIPTNLNVIDTDRLLSESGLSKADADFYNYQDFIEADASVRAFKKENGQANKYWRELLRTKGPEEASRLFLLEFPEQDKDSPSSQSSSSSSKKRKTPPNTPSNSSSSSSSSNKAAKIEEDQDLRTTMKDIESKILRSSAINYYSDYDSSSSEERETDPQPATDDFEIEDLSSSSSSSDEEPPVPLKKTPQPTRSSGNNPRPSSSANAHVPQKKAPLQNSNSRPGTPVNNRRRQ